MGMVFYVLIYVIKYILFYFEFFFYISFSVLKQSESFQSLCISVELN